MNLTIGSTTSISVVTSRPTSQVHVTVGTSAWDVVLVGLVGGITILIGVVATEVLIRFRERRRDLNQSMANLRLMSSGLLFGLGDTSSAEVRRTYFEFVETLATVGRLARWPISGSKEIRQEVGAITARYAVSIAAWRAHNTEPKLAEIMGDKINLLVAGTRSTSQSTTDEALSAAGYPRLDEWENDAAWEEAKQAASPEGLI
jgi:hypothetical protein